MATATNLSINCIFTFRDTEEMEKSIILNRFSVVFYFIIIIIILHSPFRSNFSSYLSSIFYSSNKLIKLKSQI